MLNRRMPNGMYGGVRGGFNSPYSIGAGIARNSDMSGICLTGRLLKEKFAAC